SKFALDTGPDGTWSAPGGAPHISITFSGAVRNACDCFFRTIDVDVDVTVEVEISIASLGVLRVHSTYDWDADDLEVVCCVVTAGLYGAWLAGSFGGWAGPIGAVAGAVIGFVGATLAAAIAAAKVKAPLPTIPSCTGDDDAKVLDCTQPVPALTSELF